MDAENLPTSLPSEVATTPAVRLLRRLPRLRTVALCAVSAVLAFAAARSALSSVTTAALQLSTRFGPVQRAPLAQSGPVFAPAPATTAAWTRADVNAVRMQWPEALLADPEAFYTAVYEGAPDDAEARPRTGTRAGTPVMMGKGKDGPFTPVVLLTKRIMGKDRFTKFRGNVIAQHTKVIQAFVETSDSPLGCIALEKLFELADKDKSGTIDREELENALYTLGFTHLRDEQIDQILKRADGDDNCVIDYDEFVKEAPKTLKTNLVKLAKENGAELGFLS